MATNVDPAAGMNAPCANDAAAPFGSMRVKDSPRLMTPVVGVAYAATSVGVKQ
jgi:hypothetical protein